MVRTRDTSSVKVVGAKASRKGPPAPASPALAESSSKNKYAGGNPYCPRETPAWQKPITEFFATANGTGSCEAGPSSSAEQPGASGMSEQSGSTEVLPGKSSDSGN